MKNAELSFFSGCVVHTLVVFVISTATGQPAEPSIEKLDDKSTRAVVKGTLQQLQSAELKFPVEAEPDNAIGLRDVSAPPDHWSIFIPAAKPRLDVNHVALGPESVVHVGVIVWSGMQLHDVRKPEWLPILNLDEAIPGSTAAHVAVLMVRRVGIDEYRLEFWGSGDSPAASYAAFILGEGKGNVTPADMDRVGDFLTIDWRERISAMIPLAEQTR